MDKMLENNADKRNAFETEAKCKLLQEKNKTLFSEVINLRKEMDFKDNELEKA